MAKDFDEQIFELTQRLSKLVGHLETEEATKHSLVLPFIRALGYDVFNPKEVIPEFTADVGIKKGEKVDYAIFKDGKPIMLFECKMLGGDLGKAGSQLYRYFSVVEARIAILTDGAKFLFYTDLDEPNKMDSKPFMEIDFSSLDETLLPELKKFSKSTFDVAQSLTCASDLKYAREIKKILGAEASSPSEEFVRFFINKIYPGRKTASIVGQFSDILKRAFNHFIDERINERLKSAMVRPEEMPVVVDVEATSEESKIVTTQEELEAYYVIKSIVRNVVDPARVFERDTQSYLGVLLDNNNRKPICKLHLNGAKKYLGLIDENKKENRVEIVSLNDIYKYEGELLATVSRYV